MKRRGLLALILCVLSAAELLADERILGFHSEIEVKPDGWLEIRESITVQVEGQRIRQGIYRDIPHRYAGRWGTRERRPLLVDQVTRNGEREPFRTEATRHGTRIWIGREGRFLPSPSRQVYQITYRTGGQLLRTEKSDVLYWNVTGNEWDFPIDQAEATVRLPRGAKPIRTEAYTGPVGATGQAYLYESRGGATGDEDHHFRSTATLLPGEGLTLLLHWPLGWLSPEAAHRPAWWREGAYWQGGLLTLLGLVWWIWSWRRVGKDPPRGLIIPRWEPPEGVSPGLARYLYRRAYDELCFTAAILGLAAKGWLKITAPVSSKDGPYEIHRTTGRQAALDEGESLLYQSLLGHRTTLRVHPDEQATLAEAKRRCILSLSSQVEGRLLSRNWGVWFFGLLIAGAGGLRLALGQGNPETIKGWGIWIVLTWVLSAVGLWVWRRHPSRQWKGRLLGLGMTGLGLLTYGIGIWQLSHEAGALAGLVIAGIGLFAWLFLRWMEAPSPRGRALLDELEGFAEYLQVAEEDRLNAEHPPEMSPERFERLFPYALALDLEQAWSEKFHRHLRASQAPANDVTEASFSPYPRYVEGGNSLRHSWQDLGASFSSALSEAAAPPPSLDSSSGGGSSGGGGGGGGGGGW